ncbi:MAG: signal recognition particle protein Srp54 [Candidatus Thermoplasmatota archaeon]|uniref:Signal recognition particle 54 kDa protein n=3 Tax=Candidatus Sysuiplasma superficiale TaxID=2823368 RepID=A0A8J7YNI0_9ARCH|nr:signal recognition particle protein Srp54 [Candidatus Sysuiplasma superficiale]MCL4346630.1 signal recognition particle protein Srp54 [Candidatus Thermoplasmatota archaeon]
MVLDALGESLRSVIKRITGSANIDEKFLKEIVRDIQRALLQADVNVNLVMSLTKKLEQRALNEKVPAGGSLREHVIKIIYEELASILGESRQLPKEKQTIMLVGLYGQGKTTTAGKLARFLSKRGLSVGLIAADVHRPAAYDQLEQIGKEIKVPVFGIREERDPLRIVSDGMKQFSALDVKIIDTSGRHSLEPDLIDEIKRIEGLAKPEQRILVLDASVGQQAGSQAKAFHEAVNVNGVILTKLDGSAKGGGALSAVGHTGAPIIFIGTGEHLEDLETFDTERFISRLLGMGDLHALLEKMKENIDEGRAEETARKIMSGHFTLREMYEQMEMMADVGPLKKIMSMLPGMPGMRTDIDPEELQARLHRFRVIMDSMTDDEMENPKIIKSSRIMRIARGAGTEQKNVRELLKQYNLSRRAVKGFLGNRKLRRQLMKQMREQKASDE